MQAPAIGVLVQPTAEARPFPQQSLVGDLGAACCDSYEPTLRQRSQYRSCRSVELGERDLSPHRRPALSLAREAQEDVARHPLLLVVEPLERGFRQTGDRSPDAVRLFVR